ncbi:hypothetical protein BAUCODRAFT_118999 [Baudoinia panamericana UAMH 10762]|uniref:N-acetyltransferase domain-containing protein n=1 Tax=Baudoinia panamericana (strain UAMH 10762) TaxID=717646 RepID=M2M2G2_BAUPA|nr:uncharacterized protein BAUCODRAFT_118999 [Baudoinia panamericana UAMH 10762]EMD01303.1 hypothetical protein BAUCODRAFT_118999 [Baudoinia panamericana UAMH 10762]
MTSGVQIRKLPKLLPADTSDAKWLETATKCRALRLHALKSSPEAFASSYEVESQRGLEATFERLGNPKAVHFLAVRIHDSGQNGAGGADNWLPSHIDELVGTLILLGPLEEDASSGLTARSSPFAKATAPVKSSEPAHQPALHSLDRLRISHYHLNGTFVHETCRGAGLGLRLIEAALSEAADRTRSAGWQTYKCSVLVNQENDAARRLYEKAGFAIAGSETYSQQRRTVAGEPQKVERVALSMELTRDLETKE